MPRLVAGDRRATVTQITSLYLINWAEKQQNTQRAQRGGDCVYTADDHIGFTIIWTQFRDASGLELAKSGLLKARNAFFGGIHMLWPVFNNDLMTKWTQPALWAVRTDYGQFLKGTQP